MQKSADFVALQNRPILSSNVERVLFSAIKSANVLYIGQQILCFYGDCLQWEMNIYCSYLFCLLLYNVYFY